MSDDERKSAIEGLIGGSSPSEETEEASPTEETEEIGDGGAEQDSSPTQEASEGQDTQETEETQETRLVEETHDLHMYLPESRYRELMSMYKRLDGEYYAATGEELEKNREYFDAVIGVALEHDEELRTRLGISD